MRRKANPSTRVKAEMDSPGLENLPGGWPIVGLSPTSKAADRMSLQALAAVAEIIDPLPDGGSQTFEHLTIVHENEDQPRLAADPLGHRGVQLLPNLRFQEADLAQEDDDSPGLLQPPFPYASNSAFLNFSTLQFSFTAR